MARDSRWGWLTVLGALVICLPCLLLPLAALGAGALLATAGGVLTGALWLFAAGAALAVVLGAALLVRWRRQRAACCEPTTDTPEPSRRDPLEVR